MKEYVSVDCASVGDFVEIESSLSNSTGVAKIRKKSGFDVYVEYINNKFSTHFERGHTGNYTDMHSINNVCYITKAWKAS